MAPRADLPRAYRRAANRSAIPGRQPSDHQRALAEAGMLTRNNTKPGTRGRQAVDSVIYLRRKAARPNLPAREALGHPVAGTRSRVATFFADAPPRMVTVEGLSAGDMSRAGRYMAATQALVAARRTADWAQVSRAFEARFRRWKPIAGLTLLADPNAVVALAERERVAEREVIFDSGRSRPGRRRRAA